MGISCWSYTTHFNSYHSFDFSVDWGFFNFRLAKTNGSISMNILTFFVTGPLTLGGYYLGLNILREKQASIGNVFIWFSEGKRFLKSFYYIY